MIPEGPGDGGERPADGCEETAKPLGDAPGSDEHTEAVAGVSKDQAPLSGDTTSKPDLRRNICDDLYFPLPEGYQDVVDPRALFTQVVELFTNYEWVRCSEVQEFMDLFGKIVDYHNRGFKHTPYAFDGVRLLERSERVEPDVPLLRNEEKNLLRIVLSDALVQTLRHIKYLTGIYASREISFIPVPNELTNDEVEYYTLAELHKALKRCDAARQRFDGKLPKSPGDSGFLRLIGAILKEEKAIYLEAFDRFSDLNERSKLEENINKEISAIMKSIGSESFNLAEGIFFAGQAYMQYIRRIVRDLGIDNEGLKFVYDNGIYKLIKTKWF